MPKVSELRSDRRHTARIKADSAYYRTGEGSGGKPKYYTNLKIDFRDFCRIY